MEETDPKYRSEIDKIFNGDLCALMYDYTDCFGAREEASKGLLSLNSMMVSYTLSTKLAWDRSGKTKLEAQQIFNKSEVISMEWAYWLYIPPAYQQLENITKLTVLENISNFKTNSSLFITLFVIVFIILLIVVWLPIWNVFRDERIKLQKIYRIIPMSIIKSNRFISNYLINNTDGMLNPVKHLL
jgi:hypothetical protein